MVTISESGETSVRVSWGPLQPQTVTSYFIEYSALPGGKLLTKTVSRTQNSTLLENLQPGTTYLVTVTARHASGTERAMSVKVCTQEGERWVFYAQEELSDLVNEDQFPVCLAQSSTALSFWFLGFT